MKLTTFALRFAKNAHEGQTDKCGMPYWLHLYRVGLAVSKYGETAMIVGFLHDVVEDTTITLEHLRANSAFGDCVGVVEAVDALSRRDGESYKEYIHRVEKNELALQVKIADLNDNLREDRVRNLWGMSKFKTKTKSMYRQYLTMLMEKHKPMKPIHDPAPELRKPFTHEELQKIGRALGFTCNITTQINELLEAIRELKIDIWMGRITVTYTGDSNKSAEYKQSKKRLTRLDEAFMWFPEITEKNNVY